MTRKLRIVFFGTPEFAVPSLLKLIEDGHQIVSVVTAPDKPAGRGMTIRESPVKQVTQEKGLPILQPTKLKDEQFLKQLELCAADLFVVVAFRMLPEEVWGMPELGTINLHASLLPDYRGAAPINWAIINGESISGLTTFFIQKMIDTGDIIQSVEMKIEQDETAGELHDRMKIAGSLLLSHTVDLVAGGTCVSVPQNSEEAIHPAPKLTKDVCKINWNRPVAGIYNLIRGLSPAPTAFTMMDGKVFKIYEAVILKDPHSENPGRVTTSNGEFKIAAADGYVYPLEVQLEGKNKMSIMDFMKGFRPSKEELQMI